MDQTEVRKHQPDNECIGNIETHDARKVNYLGYQVTHSITSAPWMRTMPVDLDLESPRMGHLTIEEEYSPTTSDGYIPTPYRNSGLAPNISMYEGVLVCNLIQ